MAEEAKRRRRRHPAGRGRELTESAERRTTWLVLGVIAGAAAIGYGIGERRTELPAPVTSHKSVVIPALVGEPVGGADAEWLFAHVGEVLAGAAPDSPPEPDGNLRFGVVTLGRPGGGVRIASGSGGSTADALAQATQAALAGATNPAGLKAVRIDVLAALEPAEPLIPGQRLRLGEELGLVGLFLPDANQWVMPDEILARRLFTETDASIAVDELLGYLGTPAGDGGPTEPRVVRRARFHSFLARDQAVVPLYRGNPPPGEPTRERLLDSATRAGHYLLRHQRSDGSFDYLYQPWNDAVAADYNVLRHAGTCYALHQLATETGLAAFAEAADRGLTWLFEKHSVARNNGAELAIVEQDEAKLGGAALALLATVQAPSTSRTPQRLDAARKLARYILSQQEPSGRFVSKTTWSTQDPDDFESAYYPGEAIFALMRLHTIDPNPDWIGAAERGARFLIEVRDRDKRLEELDHDHWLLMGLEELHRSTGRSQYVEQGRRIGDAIVAAMNTGPYPDWVGSYYRPPRATPASTRAEGLIALIRTLERSGADAEKYRQALEKIVTFVIRCQITNENALFYSKPAAALGGVRKSLTSNAVRIDFVQHAISGFLGAREVMR